MPDQSTCRTCGRPFTPLRAGECEPCYRYRRRHGVERPHDTINRRAPLAPRDGDKHQARARIGRLVREGRLPSPRTLPCVDCGHLWAPGERPHEYDHFLGYGAAHHLDVQAVCSVCHYARELARGARHHKARSVPACIVCGFDRPPFSHGRCARCRVYYATYGRERPSRLWTPARR